MHIHNQQLKNLNTFESDIFELESDLINIKFY